MLGEGGLRAGATSASDTSRRGMTCGRLQIIIIITQQ